MNLRPCPFCGEKLRVKIVQKHMRRANGRDFAPAAYGYCLKCKSRGPLIVGDAKDVMNNAAVAWNGFTATPTELGPLFGIDYGTKSETVIMRAEVTDDGLKMQNCNNGDCERKSYGAEPCIDCPFCDQKGNL